MLIEILIYVGVNIRLLSLRIWGRTDHWGYKLLRNDLSDKKQWHDMQGTWTAWSWSSAQNYLDTRVLFGGLA